MLIKQAKIIVLHNYCSGMLSKLSSLYASYVNKIYFLNNFKNLQKYVYYVVIPLH